MRILFVSGESAGGAPKSTIELARLLARRGHEVDVLLGDRPSTDAPYQRAVNLYIKARSVPVLGRVLRRLLRVAGRRASSRSEPGALPRVFDARLPENAYLQLHAECQYDVVVANSLPRLSIAWMDDDLRSLGTPFVVYLRESHAVTHFSVTALRPSGVVANSRELQRVVAGEGVPCDYVPSVVDFTAAEVVSSRETVVLVNPIEANRPELVAYLAAARPDIPFVLQESWPLEATDLAHLESLTAAHRNLSLRRRTDSPADVYRDARVLLATYPFGRPRVVLEAQHNGIPVLALGQPALAEAVGRGGVLMAGDARDEEWLQELERLWDDRSHYDELASASREWSRRDEVQPDQIAARFEHFLESIVEEDGRRNADSLVRRGRRSAQT